MNRSRSVLLLAALSPLVAACRDTAQAKAAQVQAVETARKQALARRLASADANPEKQAAVAEWIMPPQLREISGLTLTSRGTVLTHDDNVARVYEIDPKTGILLKGFSLEGGVRGDFEAITIAGNDIFLLESKGKLYKFREGADATQVPYSLYDTKLGKECEFESLAYEADSTRLVMVCKKIRGKSAPHEVLIYRFPMPLDRATMTTIGVPIEDVAGSNKWKDFHASDITIDPITRNYVMIASREKGFVVMTPDGDVVRSGPLPGDHRQPEGVAITTDRLLLISDESNVRPAAITLYPWRP
jgi:uncharacterized protein YjiK